jgi:hypothetical protein
MGADKKSKGGGGGGFKWGSAMIWAGGQWAVCWFITENTLWATISACFSAFFAGWTTSAILGRFAKWGANAWIMMILGALVGVAVFSGAFSGIGALINWMSAKGLVGASLGAVTSNAPSVDWEKLQAFLLSWAVVPPAALGLLTGLYVRMKTPKGGGGKK